MISAKKDSFLAFVTLTGVMLVLSGCNVPEHMHVTEGNSPNNVDTDVRFRTTYYFRVFDYCYGSNENYKKIVPETDTLYRYRMTGKSSALFNQIKFESGVLKSADIDPFGTDLVYNSDVNGYVVRDKSEIRKEISSKAEARAQQEAQNTALNTIDRLKTLHDQLASSPSGSAAITKSLDDTRAALLAKIKNLSESLAGTTKPLPQTDAQAVITEIKKLETLVSSNNDAAKSVETEILDRLAEINRKISPDNKIQDVCAPNQELRKGFQVMGPEGVKTFNQDERLIMAMYTGAKTLTEMLQEYSGRILKSQVNPAAQLLPLAQESLATVEAQRAVDQAILNADGNEPEDTIDALFTNALTKLERK